jgi:hypothetical protein
MANPYINDHVSSLRDVAAKAKAVFFTATALRGVGKALGYDTAIVQADLAGSNADLEVADVHAADAFFDTVTAQLADHPEQFQALLKLARGGQA